MRILKDPFSMKTIPGSCKSLPGLRKSTIIIKISLGKDSLNKFASWQLTIQSDIAYVLRNSGKWGGALYWLEETSDETSSFADFLTNERRNRRVYLRGDNLRLSLLLKSTCPFHAEICERELSIYPMGNIGRYKKRTQFSTLHLFTSTTVHYKHLLKWNSW